MSGGKGFIGLATMIFGKWTPLGTAGAGLLFGLGEAISLRVSSAGIPPQFIDMIPVITMFVLAGVVGRAIRPQMASRIAKNSFRNTSLQEFVVRALAR